MEKNTVKCAKKKKIKKKNRKTTGRNKYIEHVRLWLTVLIPYSQNSAWRWEMLVYKIVIYKNVLWREFQYVVCCKKCHAVMLIYFWFCCLSKLNRYIKLTWVVGTKLIAS